MRQPGGLALGKGMRGGLDPGHDRAAVNPGHDDAAGIERLWPLDGIAGRDRRKPKDRALFGNRARIRDRAERVHLKVVVVVKTEGLRCLHPLIEAKAQRVEPFAGARMGREDHRYIVAPGDLVQGFDQHREPCGVVDVFLAVQRRDNIAAAHKTKPRQHIGRLDPVAVLRHHLEHRAASEGDPTMRNPFGQQVPPCVLGIDEVEIGDVVDEAAVGLFRHVAVKRTVPGLHMVDRDLHPPRHDRRNGRIGIAKDQHRLGFLGLQHLFRFNQNAAKGFGKGAAPDAEKMVGLAQPEIVEKHVVQRVVPVLPGVNHHVIGVTVEPFDNP